MRHDSIRIINLGKTRKIGNAWTRVHSRLSFSKIKGRDKKHASTFDLDLDRDGKRQRCNEAGIFLGKIAGSVLSKQKLAMSTTSASYIARALKILQIAVIFKTRTIVAHEDANSDRRTLLCCWTLLCYVFGAGKLYARTHIVSLRHRRFTTQGRAIASDHPPTDIVNSMGFSTLSTHHNSAMSSPVLNARFTLLKISWSHSLAGASLASRRKTSGVIVYIILIALFPITAQRSDAFVDACSPTKELNLLHIAQEIFILVIIDDCTNCDFPASAEDLNVALSFLYGSSAVLFLLLHIHHDVAYCRTSLCSRGDTCNMRRGRL